MEGEGEEGSEKEWVKMGIFCLFYVLPVQCTFEKIKTKRQGKKITFDPSAVAKGGREREMRGMFRKYLWEFLPFSFSFWRAVFWRDICIQEMPPKHFSPFPFKLPFGTFCHFNHRWNHRHRERRKKEEEEEAFASIFFPLPPLLSPYVNTTHPLEKETEREREEDGGRDSNFVSLVPRTH